jgi:beta-N-acetylhexosaminidase
MKRLLYLLAVLYLLPLIPTQSKARVDVNACHADISPMVRFFMEDDVLDAQIDRIVGALSYREMIAELIVTSCGSRGRDINSVVDLISGSSAGGVMFLGATSREIREYTNRLTIAAEESALLLPIFAIDGEPMLLHERITDLPGIPEAGRIRTEQQSREAALYIGMVLRSLGIHVNYAPVCDYSLNREVIGSRSFGREYETVSRLSEVFISTTQAVNIAATAKHFPGHGSVEGDSHLDLLFIQGDPLEIPVFQRVINRGVVFIMVGHIGVQGSELYGTDNRPSSLSYTAITKVLKRMLGFRGIVITDALNMQAVKSFDSPGLQAFQAGSDMALMPENEEALIDMVRFEMGIDDAFRIQIEESVRKIVRLKLLLGLINKKELQKKGLFDDIY